MKNVSNYIWDLWNNGGPFIGEDAPNAIVLVWDEWELQNAGASGVVSGDEALWGQSWEAGLYANGDPNRPWLVHQLPNLRSIQIDRNLDQDAATCIIECENWGKAQDPTRSDVLGTRGPLSWFPGWGGGVPAEQVDRWHGFAQQETPGWTWGQIMGLGLTLSPNMLVKTYQGYGGRGESLGQALADGHLTQTGVWLIDDIVFSHDGKVQIHCRDLAKLLIEQPIWPQTTPTYDSGLGYFDHWYPLQFSREYLPHIPHYDDYTDIIVNLMKWAGWLEVHSFYDIKINLHGPAVVLGNYETTGAYFPDGRVSPDVFDKRPIIDGIHAIKEIVGYAFFIDEYGLPRFETPNYFVPGNWDENRDRVGVPDIDERLQLTGYSVTVTDRSAREEVIVSSGDPWMTWGKPVPLEWGPHMDPTTSTSVWHPISAVNRRIMRPAVWSNGFFRDSYQRAELVRLLLMFIIFDLRLGSPLTCPANPAVQINDQVRIWEETTGESYIHYVRGISTHQDLTTGEYSMTLSTNWLGDYPDQWAANLGTTGPEDLILVYDQGGEPGASLNDYIELPKF